MSLIYLCGPITGLSYDEARFGWRKKVRDALACTDIECLSPMRHKDNLAGIRSLSRMGDPDSVMSNSRGITTRDRFDTFRADLLFCNFLGATAVSAGTMIEFGWADAFRVPILCCIEPDGSNPNDHAMSQELMGWRCSSLDEGIDVVRRVLLRGL